jgi:hypothetical protein
MKMQVPIHPIDRFTRHENSLIAEVSDFGNNFAGRVFDDACDIGFEVQGRTHKVLFTHSSDIVRDGEVQGWVFTPTFSIDKLNAGPITKVTVFND